MQKNISILASEGEIQLIRPSKSLKWSYWLAQREGKFALRQRYPFWFSLAKAIDGLANDKVNQVFWLVKSKQFLAEIEVTILSGEDPLAAITHYCTRSTQQRRGHATLMLHLMLSHIKSLGYKETNLRIHLSNTASRRVAEANGAIFWREAFAGYHDYIIAIT